MSIKYSAQGKVLKPADFNNSPSQTDAAFDYYSKNQFKQGWIFQGVTTNQTTGASGTYAIGPQTEVDFQVSGTATLVISVSLDGQNWFVPTSTTGSDGIIRITNRYRLYQFGLTGVSGTAGVYMVCS